MGKLHKYNLIMIGPDLNARGGIANVAGKLAGSHLFKNLNGVYLSSNADTGKIKKIYVFFSCLFLFCLSAVTKKNVVTYIHSSSSASFFRKSVFILLSKLLCKKTIIHIHPSHFKSFFVSAPVFMKQYILFVLRKCDAVVFLTFGMSSYFKPVLKPVPVFVLSNPINIEDYAPLKKAARESKTLVYFGAILPQKGVFDLLEAVKDIIMHHDKDIKMRFFGDKKVVELRGLIKKYNLGGNVSVHGWISHRRLVDELYRRTLLVLPSYSEGIPVVLLEAMAAKTPILTTKVGGIPEILSEETCTFVKPGNVADLREKIIYCLNNQAVIRDKAERAFCVVKQWELDKVTEKWEKIITG